MEYSKVIITFNAIPIGLSLLNVTYNTNIEILEGFYSERTQPFYCKIGIDAQDSAKNYYDAIVADYLNAGLFSVSLSGNVVTLTSLALNTVFAIAPNNNIPGVTIVIDNKAGQAPPIEITTNVFSRNAAAPEFSVYNTVDTNVLATEIDTGSGFVANTSKPFQFLATRGLTYFVRVKDAQNNIFSKDIKSPAVLNDGNIIVAINNQPAGALVKFELYDEYGLTLQYSLDGVIYNSTNTLNGMLPGNYTVYIKDQFNVIASKPFTIAAFNPNIEITNAYSYISESMSIRFKKNEVWDNVDIYRMDHNTLACEENKLIAFNWRQYFKPEDVIKTQLLSNYDTISVNIISEGIKTPLAINTPIRFIGLNDRRDGNLFQLPNGKAGVYFTTGNTYDYSTGVQTGTFALNGALPEYVAKGNYMNVIGSGWFSIIDIIFNETLNADVAVLDFNYVGAQKTLNVASLYNQNNYNVCEFTIDMANYLGKEFQVEINQSMTGFADFNYLSEVIAVENLGIDYYELQWSNNKDSNVFYSTGLKNKANLFVLDFEFEADSSIDINRTNQTSILISGSVYQNKKIAFDAVPTGIAKQLVQALMHQNLCINKVLFIAADVPEVQPQQNTNLSLISCLLTQPSYPPFLSSPE
jgi:hypothetical protein